MLLNTAFSVTVFDFASPRPVLQLIMRNGRSETILNTSQHYHDKESALDCHIARLDVVRSLERVFEIDHSGFSFISANSTLKVSEHFCVILCSMKKHIFIIDQHRDTCL